LPAIIETKIPHETSLSPIHGLVQHPFSGDPSCLLDL
jgi:hypothetical protein